MPLVIERAMLSVLVHSLLLRHCYSHCHWRVDCGQAQQNCSWLRARAHKRISSIDCNSSQEQGVLPLT